jgi:hypothetical protein
VFAQAINWFPDPSEAPGLLITKIPKKIKKYEILIKSYKVKKSKIDPNE